MSRATEFIALSRAVCVDRLAKSLGPAEAEDAADDIVYGIIGLYAGAQIYVSKQDSLDRKARDKQIAAEYDGTKKSVEHLSRKWNVSEIHVQRILKRA